MKKTALSLVALLTVFCLLLAGCKAPPEEEPEILPENPREIIEEDLPVQTPPPLDDPVDLPEQVPEEEAPTEAVPSPSPPAEQAPEKDAGILSPTYLDAYQPPATTGSRRATPEEVETINATLSGLTRDSVTYIVATSVPTDFETPYPLSSEEAGQLIDLLQTGRVREITEEEYNNPYMGGGTLFTLTTTSGTIYFTYTGWVVWFPSQGDLTLVTMPESGAPFQQCIDQQYHLLASVNQ